MYLPIQFLSVFRKRNCISSSTRILPCSASFVSHSVILHSNVIHLSCILMPSVYYTASGVSPCFRNLHIVCLQSLLLADRITTLLFFLKCCCGCSHQISWSMRRSWWEAGAWAYQSSHQHRSVSQEFCDSRGFSEPVLCQTCVKEVLAFTVLPESILNAVYCLLHFEAQAANTRVCSAALPALMRPLMVLPCRFNVNCVLRLGISSDATRMLVGTNITPAS